MTRDEQFEQFISMPCPTCTGDTVIFPNINWPNCVVVIVKRCLKCGRRGFWEPRPGDVEKLREAIRKSKEEEHHH